MTPPSTDSQLRSYYAARAAEYDAIYLKPERQRDLSDIERFLPPIFAGARVLEIACGTGYWTRFIATTALSIVAVDAAPETLKLARARVPDDRVRFEAGDAYDLSRHAGSYDAAFGGFWFSHVPRARRREFLAGLNAALRPGADVVLIDNRYVEGSSTAIAVRDPAGDTWQRRTLADGSTHRVLKNFPDEAELQDAVRGLARDATYRSWEFYWAFHYVVAP